MGKSRLGTHWIRCLLLVVIAAGGTAAGPPDVGAQTTDLTDQVTVTTANERSFLNRRTRQVTSVADVTVTNGSGTEIAAPLHAVIVLSSPNVSMPDALGGIGQAPYDTYYYDLEPLLGDGILSPGESVTFRARFVRSYRVRFTYEVRVYGETGTGPPNQPPVADAGPDQQVQLQAGQAEVTVVLDGTGSTDPDGSVAAYQWTGSPDPDDSARPSVVLGPGTYTFTLVVTDDRGASSAPDEVTVTVEPAGNRPPEFTSPPLTEAVEGLIYYYDAEAVDPEGAPVRFRAQRLPPGMVLWEESGLLVWTPSPEQVGDHAVELVAVDPDGAEGRQEFTVTVAHRNRAPFITSVPKTFARGGSPYTYPVTAYDPEGEPLVFSLVEGPDGMTLDGSSGVLRWTPDPAHTGTETVTVQVTDPHGDSDTQTFMLQVVDEPFELSVSEPTGVHQVFVGDTLTLDLSANHPGAGFSVAPLPRNARLEGKALIFSPGPDQVGRYPLSVTARLGDLVAQSLVTIEVVRRNRPPAFRPVPTQSFVEGQAGSFTVEAVDPDGDPLTYSLVGAAPDNAFFDAPQRTFHFTPSYDQAGTYTVTFAASDGSETATLAVALEVSDAAAPPGAIDLVVDPPESPTFNTTVTITGSVVGESRPPSPAPTVLVTGLDPASVSQGTSRDVLITGYNTAFDGATFTADFGAGITVDGVEVLSPTRARVSLTVEKTAEVGPRTVRVTSGGVEVYSIVAFSVTPGRATVSGQILDALSHTPVAGATVSVFGGTVSAQTDADGRFVLEGVAPGTVTVVVTRPNYAPARVDLTVGVNDTVALDQPIPVVGLAEAPAPGGTLPRSATVGSVLDRGVTSKDGAESLEQAEAVIVDTLITVGGSLVGVLDEAGNQLNPYVEGEGVFSLTPRAVENHARALVEGGVYTVDDIITTMQSLFRFPAEPLTVANAVASFQAAVDEAWADPTRPDSAMAIVLFNPGRVLSPSPPRITPATRLNRFQAFLLLTSFIVDNYATLSISVDELLERKGVDYRDFLGCADPGPLPPDRGDRLAFARAARALVHRVLAGLETVLGPAEASAQPPPGTVTVLPPNYDRFDAPGTRLSPERREMYAKVWQGITKDVVVNAAWGTAESVIGDMVVNAGIGMLMGSTGGVPGATLGAVLGGLSSVVGFGQELLLKMVTAWVAAESTVALMPTPPSISSTEFDEEGNLVIAFERSPAEIQAKTGEGPALGFLNPDVLHFSYLLFEFPNASTVRQKDAVPVSARLTLDYDDERNFTGDYPTGRLKFVIPKHKLRQDRRYYFRIATIQYVRNMDADLVKGVASFDTNGNGQVDLAEFDGTAEEFNLLDRDGSGGLDPDEFSRDPHPFTLDPVTITQMLDDPAGDYPLGARLFPYAKIDFSEDYYKSQLEKDTDYWAAKAADRLKAGTGVVASELKKKDTFQGASLKIEAHTATEIQEFTHTNEQTIQHTVNVMSYAENVSPGALNDEIVATKLGGPPTTSQDEAIRNISKFSQEMDVAANRVNAGNKAYMEVDALISAHKNAPPDQLVTVEYKLLDKEGKPYLVTREVKVSELSQVKADVELEIRNAQVDHYNASSKKNQWKQSLISETVPEYDSVKHTRNDNMVELQAVQKSKAHVDAEADTEVNKLKKANRKKNSKSSYEFDLSESYKGFDALTEAVGSVNIVADNLAAFLKAIKVLKSEYSPCIVYTAGTALARSQFPPSVVPSPDANDPGAMLRSLSRPETPKRGWIAREYPGEENVRTEVSAGFPPDFLTADVRGRIYAVNLNSTARFGGRLFRFTPTSPTPPFGLAREYVGNIMYYSVLIHFGRPANPIAMAMGPPFPVDPAVPDGPQTQDLFVANYDFVDGKPRILRVPVSEIDRRPDVYGSGDRSHLVGQKVAESPEFQFTGPSDMELGPNHAGLFPTYDAGSDIYFSDEQRVFVLTPVPGTDAFTLQKLLDLPGRRFSGLAFDSAGKLYLADYASGEVYVMLWEDLRNQLSIQAPINSEDLFRQKAWLVASGLENPGDIEIEQNSLLAQRALVVSTTAGLERLPLPIVGRLDPRAADRVVEIRIQDYNFEGKAAFLADHGNQFLVPTTYDQIEAGTAELRLRYRDPADGHEFWVKRNVRMATWGATVLRDLR